jgi:hypothetical protein
MKAEFTKSDLRVIGQALRDVLDGKPTAHRLADYDDPRHPQRIEYLLRKHEKLLSAPDQPEVGEAEE